MKVQNSFVVLAMGQLGCTVEQVFVDGFRYAERYLTLREFQFYIGRYFKEGKIPTDVIDYCLDVMANRARPLPKLKQLKGHPR